MTVPLISIQDARVSHYGAQVLFENLNFTIHKGEHTAVLGANGAGKSSLLCLLRGEMYPQKGRVLWHHGDSVESSPLIGRRMTSLVSTAQQELYVRNAWKLSAMDMLLTAFSDSHLLYTVPSHNSDDQWQREQACRMAARLGCTHLLHMEAPELSQGQLRLILLGRALLRRCAVLLLDEYTDGLDTAIRSRVLDILEEEAAHCTLVMTAHRLSALPSWMQRRVRIQDGMLTEAMTEPASKEPASKESGSKESGTKESGPHTSSISVQEVQTPPHEAQKSYAVDSQNKHDSQASQASQGSASPLIRVRNVTVFVERKAILHDLCWTLCRHAHSHENERDSVREHWRISGGNGAGKSSFLRLLAGEFYAAYGGCVERFVRPYASASLELAPEPVTELASIRRAIRLVSDREQACYAQTRERVHDMTAFELVLSGYDGTVGLYEGIYGAFSEVEKERVHALLRRFGLATLEQRRIRTLSSGQLRRLFLARALVSRAYVSEESSAYKGDAWTVSEVLLPEILLLDEPFSGLDAQARLQMLNMLEDIATDVHLVLVSHYDEDCPTCINRHAHMEQGRIYM